VTIEVWRKRIDEIDRDLVALVNKRAELAVRVGEEKRRRGTGIQDPEREDEVLRRIRRLNGGPLSEGALDAIYREIMAGCTEVQSSDAAPRRGTQV
jgi:chorismate mutase-like protein